MYDSIQPERLTRLPRASLLVAAIVSGVLVAGCAGSAHSQTAATTDGASTSTSNGASSGSNTPGASGSGLAFANCMRANGAPNFPDPSPRGGFLFSTAGINPAAPAFKAAQAKCQKLLPGGALPSSGPAPSAQTLAKLLKIAECMRQHGISGFPDPRTSLPPNPFDSGAGEITNFDGAILLFRATLNMQAPAYRQALAACGAPPLGLPH